MRSIEERKRIAGTIIHQIGGVRRLSAMTGAHSFVAMDSGVLFKMKGRNAPGCGNVVRIELSDLDLYSVKVGTVRKGKVNWKHESEGVYAEMLKGIIENATGRYLSL